MGFKVLPLAKMTERLRVLFQYYPANLPIFSYGLGVLVVAAMMLPPVYLVIRAAGEGADLWAELISSSVLNSLVQTILLTAAVTASVIVIAVPAAWITVRTDLPLRRIWSVLLALPLVFPSYIGAFILVSALGPKGMLQDLLIF